MSPQIVFYLIDGDTPLSRLQFTCRLLEKIYAQKKRTYVFCSDKQQAFQLDELLWTYRDDSFIPHNLCTEKLSPPPIIQIGFEDADSPHRDVLFNLDFSMHKDLQKYQRCIHIVNENDDIKLKARELFRSYREDNISIQTHDLTNKMAAA